MVVVVVLPSDRHRNQCTGAHLEKYLHLRGNLTAPLRSCQQLRYIRSQPRRAKDHILVQAPEIVLPQLQTAAILFQLLRQRPQGGPIPLVTGRDPDLFPQQKPQQRCVAHPNADDGHSLILQRI